MNKTKYIAFYGMAIALYVVLGMTTKIPLISHIGTDLGYIVFGFCCYTFGWTALIIGIIGCLFESLLISGWVPIGWMLGQVAIGLLCGIVYKKYNNKAAHVIATIVAVFIGIVVIKTGVECVLYSIPLMVKVPKNLVAFVADVIPMLIGWFIGITYNKQIVPDA